MSHKDGFSSAVLKDRCPFSLWCQKHRCWSECSRGSESISQVALIDRSVCSLTNSPTAAQIDRTRRMRSAGLVCGVKTNCSHVHSCLCWWKIHVKRLSGTICLDSVWPDAEKEELQDQAGVHVQFSNEERSREHGHRLTWTWADTVRKNTGEHTEMYFVCLFFFFFGDNFIPLPSIKLTF